LLSFTSPHSSTVLPCYPTQDSVVFFDLLLPNVCVVWSSFHA